MLVSIFGDFIASLVGAGRVTKLLEEPEQGGSENVSVSSFDIRFDHVSFAYNNEEVLHDVPSLQSRAK